MNRKNRERKVSKSEPSAPFEPDDMEKPTGKIIEYTLPKAPEQPVSTTQVEEQAAKCPYCPAQFYVASNYQNHLRDKHRVKA